MTMSFALRAVAFFCFVSFATAEAATYVVIVKDLARVLLLPYGDSKLLGLVKKGEQFKVITKKNDWFNVEYKNTVGWIFQENVRVDLKTETPVKEPAPPPPPPVAVQPAPMKPQNVIEIKKPLEKPEPTAEKIEARLKKQPVKPKRVQSFAVDLPPVSVLPAETELEKTLPVMEDSTEVVSSKPSEPTKNPAVSRQAPQPAPPAVKKPDISSLPSIPSPVGTRIPYQTAKDSFVGLIQPQEKGEEVKRYFEIIDNSVNVLATVSPHSPVLGLAHNNDCYILLFEGQSWCKIRFGNVEGWVERRQGRVVDSPTMAGNVPRIILFGSIGFGVLLIIILIIIFLSISLRTKAARKVHIRKDLLIIAQSEKTVQLSLTDSTTSLAKCFSEIGFKVNYASDIDHAKNLLMHYLPDVIVVDWQLGNNVMHEMESVLSNRTSMTNILVVFYNVRDALSMPEGGIIPNVHYLGSSFSDRDVFKLVTPLIITQSETKSIRRSVESSALGGEIGHGSLIEVMQFIEIGRKTGCLYIVIEKPFGLIYFEQGRLTYAASQAKQGRDAVFEILGLTAGHFHFILDKVSQTKNVNLSTLEILMDWTKTVDEAHRT